MTPRLAATLKHLPDKPGVYLLKDASGRVLYVGKAQSLRNRVRQYWQAGRSAAPLRIESAIDQVVDVETTLTDTVSEALLLEANLVKRYQPRFNVRLKDDKSYPFIKVTLADDFPRIERTRKLPDDGSRYFGPYASASSVDESMNLIRRIFPFRTCTIEIREGERALERPCLLYHIKRCQGPCIEAIERSAYRRDIEQVMLFLEGHQEQVSRALRSDMEAASEALQFERAAALRDKVRAIERTMESQKMAGFAKRELDVLGFARSGNEAAVQLFAIRDGKTMNRDIFLLENLADASDEEALTAFVKQYYARAGSDPAAGAGALRAWPRPPSWRSSWPAGPVARCELLAPAARRGPAAHGARRAQRRRDAGARAGALAGRPGQDRSAPWRSWPRPWASPRRRSASSATTSAPSRAPPRWAAWSSSRTASRAAGEYRRFRIRDVAGQNDFASHQEVLRRRFRRALRRRGGDRRAAALAPARPGHHRRRQGPGERGPARSSTSSACTTCPWPAWPRSARSSSCPAAAEPIVLPADVGRALPAAAPARRGASLRHHLPPPGARQGRHALGAR